jgi:hypothetical protein
LSGSGIASWTEIAVAQIGIGIWIEETSTLYHCLSRL